MAVKNLGLHELFFSAIPHPPVLMPVPGPGCNEDGGTSPFEGGGRSGRSRPQMSGPSPIIAFPPSFRQNPRRLRSYQDLDAPEDEVTVRLQKSVDRFCKTHVSRLHTEDDTKTLSVFYF